MRVTVNHDGFSRTSTVREKGSDGECDWCGRQGRRFRYGTEPDSSSRVSWHEGQFCGMQCHESYHS